MKTVRLPGLIIAVMLLVSTVVPAFCQEDAERIEFRKGESSVVRNGRISGYEMKDYILQARIGQKMDVYVKSKNIYTNVVIFLKKGDTYENLTYEVTKWSGTLPENGEYVIRVKMMRAGARKKGAKADFTLKVAVR